MFWGCFHENTKGPGLFWEKDWGTIKEKAKIISVIDGWIHIHTIFMQDSVLAHAAKGTIQDLQERRIICFQWPSYSPDLNPIETVWNWMKDWIRERYDDTLRMYDEEAVDGAFLMELSNRCQRGARQLSTPMEMHTRY